MAPTCPSLSVWKESRMETLKVKAGFNEASLFARNPKVFTNLVAHALWLPKCNNSSLLTKTQRLLSSQFKIIRGKLEGILAN
jgi:hypothetical protein